MAKVLLIMNWITIIGLIAGSLTTISFLPQAIKTWRSKSAKVISKKGSTQKSQNFEIIVARQ